MNLTLRSIGFVFTSDEYKVKRLFVWDTRLEALFGQDTRFDFCHIEPRPMGRGEMKADGCRDTVSLGLTKRLDQGQIGMGNEGIQDHINTVSMRVQAIYQIAHGVGNITFRAATADEGMAFSGFRFSKHTQIAGAGAFICGVFPTGMTRTYWDRCASWREQLAALLVETDHGTLWVIGLMLPAQPTCHLRQEQRRYVGDTPTFDLPRLKVFFFRMRRTVSGAIGSITPSSTKR